MSDRCKVYIDIKRQLHVKAVIIAQMCKTVRFRSQDHIMRSWIASKIGKDRPTFTNHKDSKIYLNYYKEIELDL